METTENILKALAFFQLDRPEATWEELREALLVIAEQCLLEAHCDGSIMANSEAYQALHHGLSEAASKGSLTVDQHRALVVGKSILNAAHARLEGRPEGLVNIIDKLNKDNYLDRETSPSVSLSVSSPQEPPQEPLSWSQLSALYMAEHSVNLRPTSLTALQSCHKVLGEAFEAIGVTDLRVHTRAQMVALRDHLMKDRAPITVNRIVRNLSTVMTWAELNDHVPKAYTKSLSLRKGHESSKEAYSKEQVATLLAHANSLPASSWERWTLSLCAVTGARIGEIAQLTNEDVVKVGDVVVIDINDRGGKDLKNKHSARRVPLIAVQGASGAAGFDPEQFFEAAHSGKALATDYGIDHHRQASSELNQMIRKVLNVSASGALTLHSLRRFVASALKTSGCPEGTAKAILGHSSGSITYDLYGAGARVDLGILEDALEKALKGDKQ